MVKCYPRQYAKALFVVFTQSLKMLALLAGRNDLLVPFLLLKGFKGNLTLQINLEH